jgi:hypothetical protein
LTNPAKANITDNNKGRWPQAACVVHLFARSNDGEEHIEGNLDTVEEEQSVLVGDKFEIDGMHNWPDLPRTLTSSKKIILEFVSKCNRFSVLSWNLGIQPVVERMTRRTVVEETKGRKSNESFPVEWTTPDENLQNGKEKESRWDEDVCMYVSIESATGISTRQ